MKLLEPAQAYDLWAATYDEEQPNLILELEDNIFAGLLSRIDLRSKTIVDVGCGTGRHWPRIQAQSPSSLIGYDVSSEMLKRLQHKFPAAQTRMLQGTALSEIADASADVVISTLALAHIAQRDATFHEWDRVLRRPGHILLTDFHPAALQKGADRTFQHNGRQVAIRNHIYSLDEIRKHWTEVEFVERNIDESVKHHYEAHHALPLYERFQGTPIVYGLLFKTQ
jgi:ubiquinone/menaquinone biosynthesis C-methylase UbiE